MEMNIPYAEDFEVTGAGQSPAWANSEWHELQRVGSGALSYRTACKTLWSEQGLYFLIDCEDARLTCSQEEDFACLFKEDVVEIFLQPDETQRLYFEYEISPLNFELPILVANDGAKFMGWRPWQYEGERGVRHATRIRDGERQAGAACSGWSAEIFVPFALLQGLGHVPPRPGGRWRANVYRIDYDGSPPSQWAWCPDTGGHFHDYRNFGTFVFNPVSPRYYPAASEHVKLDP